MPAGVPSGVVEKEPNGIGGADENAPKPLGTDAPALKLFCIPNPGATDEVAKAAGELEGPNADGAEGPNPKGELDGVPKEREELDGAPKFATG